MDAAMDEAMAQFELVSQHMAEAVEARTIEGRGAILALRKDNMDAIDRLYEAAVEILTRFPAVVRYEIEAEFEDRFHAMRRAVTLHQGKWPAVLIADNPQGFLDSARRARQAKTDLIDWIRRELLPRG